MDYVLVHHGILGQKWGVRRFQNPDGSLTEAGKKRYAEKWKNEVRYKAYNEGPSDPPGLHKISGIKDQLRDEHAKLIDIDREINSEIKDYFKDREKYASIAGASAGFRYTGEKIDMESLAQHIWFYTNEDGDQGYMDSFSMWSRDHKLDNKLYDLNAKFITAEREYEKKCEDVFNDLMGDYGKQPINALKNKDYTIAKSAVNHYLNEHGPHVYGYYYLDSITKKPYTSEEKRSVNLAKQMVAKLSLGKNSTWNIVKAVNNAGLSDVSFENMSNSDWLKLKVELEKLQ